MSAFEQGVTAAYLATAAAGTLFAIAEARLLIAFLARRSQVRGARAHDASSAPPGEVANAPHVTIQLPIYNERQVVERLVRGACAQDYPRDRFDVQVLDDSTDDTRAIAARVVAELAAEGVRVAHVRRGDRLGYKAGALARGMAMSRSEYFAVFDADFVPPVDFLRRVMAREGGFAAPDVAYVQARWAFYNEDESRFTAVQALLIHRHFYVQKPTQELRGNVVAFNGSGGVWRRRAIDDAGGWSSDTLTEDLDLSYRCALRGWRGVYLGGVEAPGELPRHMRAFKLQQRRWARGSAQCLRKLAGSVVAAPRLRHRLDELAILGGYLIHPIMFANALLWPWAVLYAKPRALFVVAQAFVSVATLVAPISFGLTARELRRPIDARFGADLLLATAIGLGLMVSNTLAHVAGYVSRHGTFQRTPKGEGADAYRLDVHWTLFAELLMTAYCLWSAAFLIRSGEGVWAPASLVWSATLLLVVGMQLAVEAPRPPPLEPGDARDA